MQSCGVCQFLFKSKVKCKVCPSCAEYMLKCSDCLEYHLLKNISTKKYCLGCDNNCIECLEEFSNHSYQTQNNRCRYCNIKYKYKLCYRINNICTKCYFKYTNNCQKCCKTILKIHDTILCKKCDSIRNICHSCNVIVLSTHKYYIFGKLYCHTCLHIINLLSPDINKIAKELNSLNLAVMSSNNNIFPMEIYNEINKYKYDVNRFIIEYRYNTNIEELSDIKDNNKVIVIIDTICTSNELINNLSCSRYDWRNSLPLYTDIDVHKWTQQEEIYITENNKCKIYKFNFYQPLMI